MSYVWYRCYSTYQAYQAEFLFVWEKRGTVTTVIFLYFTLKYSRTSLMWTAKGQTKSVHNSEVSTLVKLGVATGHRGHHSLSCTCGTRVHKGGVSTRWGSTLISLQQCIDFLSMKWQCTSGHIFQHYCHGRSISTLNDVLVSERNMYSLLYGPPFRRLCINNMSWK